MTNAAIEAARAVARPVSIPDMDWTSDPGVYLAWESFPASLDLAEAVLRGGDPHEFEAELLEVELHEEANWVASPFCRRDGGVVKFDESGREFKVFCGRMEDDPIHSIELRAYMAAIEVK